MAEATFNVLAPATTRAISAGSKPAGQVHLRSIALLKQKGIAADLNDFKTPETLAQQLEKIGQII